ncbi:radical SAM protein [Helicobacter sp. MIT 05-5293]|uniref:radical SAM protein n=1 Tax=Helicobacter sp. MIT 05-5293 TaxID=1548149 RepID=UPI0013155DA3|nr:radical SAM protein [Helicobacter sp. MIT 05-5293]
MEIKIDAKSLVNPKRLDLVVKYLYAKEILENEINTYQQDIYKDLYIRHIAMRTMGEEPDKSKQNIDEYLTSFRKLIDSIRQNGFMPPPQCASVPITQDGLLADGSHRIGASVALNQDIYVKEVEQGYTWDFDWFCHNGFNTEDKQRILKGFVDIHSKKCVIFVVWNPLFAYLGNVKAILDRYFDMVGEVELDFEDNYIAFANSLLEIYERNIAQSNGDESGILAKAHLLSAHHLSYKVIVLTSKAHSDKSIEELSKLAKGEIRNVFNHLLPKEIFCTIHSSDSESECVYLANILLSPNNIRHLKMKILTDDVRSNLVSKIRNLPFFLHTRGIDSDEICVIGSGVLAALGISKDFSSDIDFIINHKYREKFGWGSVHLSDDYEIGVSSKQANGPIHDNVIIHNDNYHFWFKGIKFANLDIIKDRKSAKTRSKDSIYLRQIELFEKMMGHINQQKILAERIEFEKARRLNASQITKINKKGIFNRIRSILPPPPLTSLKSLFDNRWKISPYKKHLNNTRPFIEFTITEKCNYKCSYCSQWIHDKNNPKSLYNASDEVIDGFMRFLEKVGREFEVNLIGGEPFVHPKFIEIAKRISDKGNKVIVYTNMAFPVSMFRKLIEVTNDNLLIHGALHIAQIKDLDKNIDNIIEIHKLLGKNSKIEIVSVVEEEIFETLKYVEKRLKAHHIDFIFIRKNNKNGQSSTYSQEIESYMKPREHQYNRDMADSKKINTKKVLCYAGCRLFHVLVDGSITRCWTYQSKFWTFGNVKDIENVRILKGAKPCYSSQCFCQHPTARKMYFTSRLAPCHRINWTRQAERVFSVKNEISNGKKRKVINIAGLKIKIKTLKKT